MKKNFEKLFKNKYLLITLVMIIGLMFIFISSISDTKTNTKRENIDYEYISNLERRIETIVSSISKAGDCNVMINVSTTEETVYMKDIKRITDNEKTESENTVITAKDKNGNEYAIVTKKIMPKISGVLVACKGGNDPAVKSSVTEAVCTVLGIGANNVCVTAKS